MASCSGSVHSAGSRIAPSRSSIAGQMGVTSAAPRSAAEFARLKVDVIVTTGSSALAVKEAISTVPVAFALWADPIGSGYIASFARPGGNAWLSIHSLDTAAKRIEILREFVPSVRRLAILARLDNPSNAAEKSEVEAAARALGLDVTTSNVRRAEDIAPAIEAFKDRADAIHVHRGGLRSKSLRPYSRLEGSGEDRPAKSKSLEAGASVMRLPSLARLARWWRSR
jgi:ABC-type uncharacterized transport system substrate-binding protein